MTPLTYWIHTAATNPSSARLYYEGAPATLKTAIDKWSRDLVYELLSGELRIRLAGNMIERIIGEVAEEKGGEE